MALIPNEIATRKSDDPRVNVINTEIEHFFHST